MSNHFSHSNPASGAHKERGAAVPWVFIGFLAVAGFFFFTEHRAHLMGALPLILLALCPLMHLFHRHGAHAHDGGGTRGTTDGSAETRGQGHGLPSDASPISPAPHQH